MTERGTAFDEFELLPPHCCFGCCCLLGECSLIVRLRAVGRCASLRATAATSRLKSSSPASRSRISSLLFAICNKPKQFDLLSDVGIGKKKFLKFKPKQV